LHWYHERSQSGERRKKTNWRSHGHSFDRVHSSSQAFLRTPPGVALNLNMAQAASLRTCLARRYATVTITVAIATVILS
jgi:hypothetical protein